ncbi:DUF305 domain-containing protein [Actinoplanes sp. RD1]|uniref:DUF305 domain-containing protein n=1 Tax=Actinoplanes sp. RD1 TaxID=3064538 RepID=UPI002740370B|nr:DUF305 domain-containing protein [Actinoplanes sp. RD1]
MSRKRALIVVAALAVLVVGAILVTRPGSERSAAAPRPSASATPPQRVVLPGRPGDTARITDSDQVEAPDGSVYNGIDTLFVQMMIVHHGQALAMAELAPERAADPELRAFADRIRTGQQLEIDYYRTWLRTRKLPEDATGHDHTTMAGMQSPAAMAALAAAKGAGFDRMFVTMMTAHHEGALRMGDDVVKGGADEQLREVAGEMIIEQGIEIQRMAQLTPRS